MHERSTPWLRRRERGGTRLQGETDPVEAEEIAPRAGLAAAPERWTLTAPESVQDWRQLPSRLALPKDRYESIRGILAVCPMPLNLR